TASVQRRLRPSPATHGAPALTIAERARLPTALSSRTKPLRDRVGVALVNHQAREENTRAHGGVRREPNNSGGATRSLLPSTRVRVFILDAFPQREGKR